MFFDEWATLTRTAAAALVAYAAVIVLLRVSGKRTLAKWNAFDFIVTIALGSTLATLIVSDEVSVAQGVVAFAALLGLQFAVSSLAVRLGWFDQAIKSRPQLLVDRGHFDHEAMRRERVTEAEVRAALRGHGIAAVEDVVAVVLETDGSFSVIRQIDREPATALRDVRGFGR